MTKQNTGENLKGQWHKLLLCYIILTMCRLERKLRGVCGSILIAHIRCFWVLADLHIKARCKLQNSSILNCAHLVQMAPLDMFTVSAQTRCQCCHLDQGGRSLCCNWSINIDIGINVSTFNTCLQRYVLVASLRSRCVDLPAIQVCAPSCQVEAKLPKLANMFAGVMCIVQDPARTGFFALREPQVQYRGVWSHLPDNWQQSAPTPTRGSNRDSARQCCCALHRYEAHVQNTAFCVGIKHIHCILYRYGWTLRGATDQKIRPYSNTFTLSAQ